MGLSMTLLKFVHTLVVRAYHVTVLCPDKFTEFRDIFVYVQVKQIRSFSSISQFAVTLFPYLTSFSPGN